MGKVTGNQKFSPKVSKKDSVTKSPARKKQAAVAVASKAKKPAISAKAKAKTETPPASAAKAHPAKGQPSKAQSKSTSQQKKSGSRTVGHMKTSVSGHSITASALSYTAVSVTTTSSAAAAARAAASSHAETHSDAVCREVACEGLSTTGGYCRLHYIKNWKKIKRKELILREKKLNQYIEELVAKYPDKYIEAIRQDLASDKDFAKVIHDLDLDEGLDDFDSESADAVDSLIDSIKRDFEDETEGF